MQEESCPKIPPEPVSVCRYSMLDWHCSVGVLEWVPRLFQSQKVIAMVFVPSWNSTDRQWQCTVLVRQCCWPLWLGRSCVLQRGVEFILLLMMFSSLALVPSDTSCVVIEGTALTRRWSQSCWFHEGLFRDLPFPFQVERCPNPLQSRMGSVRYLFLLLAVGFVRDPGWDTQHVFPLLRLVLQHFLTLWNLLFPITGG